METTELLETVARGEDSRHQFKEDATNAISLGAEIVAYANSGGGQIFIGVADDGTIRGHDAAGVKSLEPTHFERCLKYGSSSNQSTD